MYQTIQIGNLSKMIPFFDFAAIEKISVDAVRHNFVAIKVDHLNGSVLFGKQVQLYSPDVPLLYAPKLVVRYPVRLTIICAELHDFFSLFE